jgi:CspA family cold shock protein
VTGTIARLVADKGFGFIRVDGVDGAADDYFFHRSALRGTQFDCLDLGDRVSFDAVDGPKGLRAENVNVAPIN